MATIAADNFNRSNRSLAGDTMSDGSSTWADGLNGGCSIDTNVAIGDSGAATADAYCDSMSNIADLTVTAKVASGDNVGVIARRTGNGEKYYAKMKTGDAKLMVWKTSGGSSSQLGADGSVVSVGDTIGIRCEGTTISGLINGVVDFSRTDSDHSTGQAGIHIRAQDGTLDDWIAETISAADAGGQGVAAQWGARWGFSRGGF